MQTVLVASLSVSKAKEEVDRSFWIQFVTKQSVFKTLCFSRQTLAGLGGVERTSSRIAALLHDHPLQEGRRPKYQDNLLLQTGDVHEDEKVVTVASKAIE